MNQKENLSDEVIIHQLQLQGIKPHVTYIHADYPYSTYKNFPTQPFLTLVEVERGMRPSHNNAIQFIELGDNYQYQTILIKDRGVIDILYPISMFSGYPDGEHFFVLDEDYQPHSLNSAEAALEQNCYLRVVIYQGKVVSIQKRPLDYIARTTFEYWPNGNKRKEISDRLDLNNTTVYRYEIEYDLAGQRTKILEHNVLTNYKTNTAILDKDGIYSTMDVFNDKGIKVNHTITHNHSSGPVESQYLDKSGNILKITNSQPSIFDSVDLPQALIYQSLPMDLVRADSYHTTNLFQQIIFNKDNTLLDKEAVNRAIFLGINPGGHYYHPTPFPKWANERYKNYPHQKGLSLAEAEFQHPKEEYVDLVNVTVGDNSQYQTILREKWRQTPLLLPLEQFKSLENGAYFFSQNEFGELVLLDSVEQAIALPVYVRVEKVMGKITSVLQKVRIQKTSQQYEYDNHNQMHKQVYRVLESQIVAPLVIETIYDNIGVYVESQTIKNDKNILISSFVKHEKDNIFGTVERFSHDGVKTNHITLFSDMSIENQYLDSAGNVKFTTDDFADKDTSQPYDDVPINPDEFEQLIFKLMLMKQEEAK